MAPLVDGSLYKHRHHEHRLIVHHSYNWSLLLGPKDEEEAIKGTRFRAKLDSATQKWVYVEERVSLQPVDRLLIRLAVGKVRPKDMEKFLAVLSKVPIANDGLIHPPVEWVRSALHALETSRVVKEPNLNWTYVSQRAMRYCLEKTVVHRFDGRGSFDLDRVPTFDAATGIETVC